MPEALKFSVIIPAFNEEDVIEDCLLALERQSYPYFDVHFIDDGSTDRTREILDGFASRNPRFQVHSYGKLGPGRARNLTASRLSSDLFAFTDADCAPHTDWLFELARCFENFPDAAAAGGPQLAKSNSNAFQRRIEKFLRIFKFLSDFYKTDSGEIRSTRHNPLCNVAYRRESFLKLGGFREDLFPGEDIELDLRLREARAKILFNPKAKVEHERPESIHQWRKVMRAYGRAQGKLLRDRGLERFVQVIGLTAWPLLVLLAFLAFWFAGPLAGAAGLIGLGLVLFWRPSGENLFCIFWNSLEWFNGFAEGFIRNSSPPPVAAPKNPPSHQASE